MKRLPWFRASNPPVGIHLKYIHSIWVEESVFSCFWLSVSAQWYDDDVVSFRKKVFSWFKKKTELYWRTKYSGLVGWNYGWALKCSLGFL